MKKSLTEKLNKYGIEYINYPFDIETATLGVELREKIANEKKKKFQNKLDGIDMKQNSYKA